MSYALRIKGNDLKIIKKVSGFNRFSNAPHFGLTGFIC
jgi:hypothetical protein